MKGEFQTSAIRRFGLWLGSAIAVLLIAFLLIAGVWLAIRQGNPTVLLGLLNPGAWILSTAILYESYPGIVSKQDSLTMDEGGLSACRGKREITLRWEEIDRVRTGNERVYLYTKNQRICLYPRNALSVGEYIAHRIPISPGLAERSNESLSQESVKMIRQSRRWRRAAVSLCLPALGLLFAQGLIFQDMGFGKTPPQWLLPLVLIATVASLVLFPLAMICYSKSGRIDENAAEIQRILERRATDDSHKS